MNAIGFNFTKLNIEDFRVPNKPVEGVKINTEMNILSIEEVKPQFLNIKTKEEFISIEFEHKVIYEPNFAKVEIKGKVLISLDSKLAKEVSKGWKSKEIPQDFRIFLFNTILRKSTLKALELEDDLNLPLHLPMPSFSKNKEDKQ
ncbi:MAG: hypothetical protein ABIJ05_03505 [Patescibacteria group bacterium]